ncbi:unnamed protein product [Bursaphelenchus xylophilus]|uniref:(pine wood nematode) hypothetical protein n=1 Tax=Bursaphelenchus xylophilus TaxID=6326 RepID=A0A1I7SL22_BURXY|nr:unnamed protein product [Bursaphelenchus xylophilus]CAG9129340.1 unnamed protein product [Bursaphelenchus xylophilus]
MATEISHSASMPVISVSQPIARPSQPTHSVSTAHFSGIDQFPLPSSRQLTDWKEEDDGCDEEQEFDFTPEQEILQKKKRKPSKCQTSNFLEVEGTLTHGSSTSSMLEEAENDEDTMINALDELDKEDVEEYSHSEHVKNDPESKQNH